MFYAANQYNSQWGPLGWNGVGGNIGIPYYDNNVNRQGFGWSCYDDYGNGGLGTLIDYDICNQTGAQQWTITLEL